jgi:cytidylate kinase
VKLYITGAPGSGKTSAASSIARQYGIRVHCLDDVIWDNSEGTKNRRVPEAIRDRNLLAIASRPMWIVEGTYGAPWVRPILERADCVIILNTPPMLRLLRLMKRHFVDRSPFRAAVDNIRLFVSNARWGSTYEAGPLPQLIQLLHATGTPFHVHAKGDLLALVAWVRRNTRYSGSDVWVADRT